MTAAEERRLEAAEEQLVNLTRELRATRAHLQFLRQLLAEDDMEAAGPQSSRPVLRVLEGGRSSGQQHIHGTDRHGLRAV
ncbi:hypothetical protein [Streptomyces sp. NBC_00996]|uniref:hypothetical protein n=1 Tax=Streptomyces sp. NBC_00996 TaxID=2903710 RepID=UPI00386979FB|nr:hypothetical protein OG390_25010 [Streptomyces sp. NBC_00996]